MAQKNVIFTIIAMVMMMVAGCTQDGIEMHLTPARDTTTVVINKDHSVKANLIHKIDTALVDKASDDMISELSVYYTENSAIVDSFHLQERPQMNARLNVGKTDYIITEDKVDCKVISSHIGRGYGVDKNAYNKYIETDTLFVSLNDGQELEAPVDITSFKTQVGNTTIDLGSDSLISARLVDVKNSPVGPSTRATYISAQYNTEYTVKLQFVEKNTNRDYVFDVYLKGYALRKVISEDAIDTVYAENVTRQVVDDKTEKCSFDKVFVMKSGETVKENNSIILNRLFNGIDPYEKIVTSFDYKFLKSNGTKAKSEETEVKSEGNWSVFGKSDNYSSDVTNNVAAELIVTDYTLYHERATYKDEYVTVDFGYVDINVSEVTNAVIAKDSNKEGYDKAIFNNAIQATYLDYLHDLREEVYLYKLAKAVLKYQIENAKLQVEKDKVTATLTFVTLFTDGTKTTENEKIELPWSVVCKSDWTVSDKDAKQTTDTAIVALNAINTKSDGYWTYTSETRDITTLAHLTSSKQTNTWQAVTPNEIIYSREGVKHSFGKIAFAAIEKGATVENAGEKNGISTYKYKDNLEVSFANVKVASVAPGTITIDGKAIAGYDYRDKKLEVQNESVTASLTWITKYVDGTSSTETVSKTFPRSLVCNSDWTAYEQNAYQTTGNITVNLEKSEDKLDGNWIYFEETRALTTSVKLNASTQNNSWTSVDPNKIAYSRGNLTVEFGTLEYSAAKENASATLAKTEKNIETYNYICGISVMYGKCMSHSSAPGKIIVEKAKEVVDHEIRDAKQEVNNNNVFVSLTYVSIYNDGSETTELVETSFPRSLKCLTNWTSTETNANQVTGMTFVLLKNSERKSNGFWSYVNETRNITTTANLSGSNQINSWESVDPNKIVYSRDGKTHAFENIEFEASEAGADVNYVSDGDEGTTYKYTDKINVTYGDNTVSSTAEGTILVATYVKDYEIADPSIKVTDSEVIASLTWITKYSNGKETSETVAQSFARSLYCLTNWTSNETNANQTTGAASVTLMDSESKKNGFWSYVNETRNIKTIATLASSNKENIWKSVDPNKIVFTREGKTYSFETINFGAKETGANVEKGTDSDEGTAYSYVDNIDVTYGDNTISSSAEGTIFIVTYIMAQEIVNPLMSIFDNEVVATLTWVTKYSNGKETSEEVRQSFPRSFITLTDWRSNEKNANQRTSEVSVQLKNSESKKNGFWSYTNETRELTSTAALDASNQTNGWQSIVPNSIVYSREGKTYNFGTINFTAQETGANVTVESENDDMVTYNYSDGVSVNFGGNTLSGKAGGKIYVNKPWNADFPAEWGKFVKATSTLSVSEDAKDWVYTWSIHFEHGTLPVVIRRDYSHANANWNWSVVDDSKANIIQSAFEYLTSDKFNSASYSGGKWVNSVASDQDNVMLWTNKDGQSLKMLAYPTATMWKWNNGKNTVFSDKYTFGISNNGLVLTVYRDGMAYMTLKAAK